MYVRMTRTQGTPESAAEAERMYGDQLVPELRKHAGWLGAILGINRNAGMGLSVTFWESEEAMRASESTADTLRARAVESREARVRDVERFEIVLREPNTSAQANSFVRVSRTQGSPDKLDAAIRLVRDQSLPNLQQQSGFQRLTIGANRQNGSMFAASTWASAAQREASDAVVSEQRRAVGEVAGGGQPEVELYEVVFAEMAQSLG
jgi:heme-degrading monooxygenase HmoA